MTIDRKIVIGEIRDLLIFVVIACIQPYFTCPKCKTIDSYALVSVFTFFMWLFLWKGNALLSHTMNGLISWFKFPIKRLVVGIISTIIYTSAAVIGLMLFFEYAFDFNFGKGFRLTIYVSIVITIIISMFLHAREFFIFWKKASVDAERLQKENILARYESLRS